MTHKSEVDTAAYHLWARTCAVSARRSSYPGDEVERRVVRLFHRICRRIEPTAVIEIGAHEAGFSRWAVTEFPGARVTAFEANPHVHAKYAQKVARAGVDYRHAAVGPVNGEVVLHLPLQIGDKARTLTSHVASLGQHTRATDQVEVTVPSVRLDDAVELADHERAVAWIDVEGANEVVLRSGPSVLDRVDAVYIEVERETTWEGQWLDVDVALHLRQHGLVPVARDVKRSHQYNVVYVRTHLAEDQWLARQAAEVLLGPRRTTD